jgi:hypothetical protein
MTFKIEDVDTYKKGLTDKQKKQYIRIASSVLKAEMKKGKSEEDATVSAIKQANGVVMNTNESKGKYSVYKNKQVLDYEVKLTVHQEKAHLVIPVVMMVEGVHNGSQGPILHTMEELGKFPESWNGIPVVITHPEEDGNAVSANSPDVIDRITVGRVYNTVVDGKKLKAEVWLDEDKLNLVSNKTLEDINETKEVEVSLGMFTENEEEEGEYEGEKYLAIAHNHRPDHLAILPDQIGACSCADGCGLGANQKSKDMAKLIDVEKTIRQLHSEGFSIHTIGNQADQGYQEKMSLVYGKLRTTESEGSYCYLEEMYDDYLIYSKNGNGENKLYKQEYKIESGKFEFVNDPVEVHKKVAYEVNALTRTKFSSNNKKEDKNMSKNECPKCLEKINALIANKDSGFDETDREWLEVLSEKALDKAITPKVKEVEKVVEKTIEVNKLSTDDQAALAFGKKQMKERKEKMIKAIQDNTEKGIWEDAVLTTMSEDMLERVFNSVKKEETLVDYSLNSGRTINANASTEDALYPAGVTIEVKK